jgi:hypothetical protein
MRTEDRVRRALAALADADAQRRARPHVERALLEAFDRESTEARSWWHAPVARAPRLVAALTVVALIVTGAAHWWKRDRGVIDHAPLDRPGPSSAAQARALPTLPPSLHAVPPVTSDVAARPRTVRHARIAKRPVVTAESDRMGSVAIDGNEIVRLVRVRLPRAALPSLGIPILEPDAAGSIDVDILFGEDGMPRTARIAR